MLRTLSIETSLPGLIDSIYSSALDTQRWPDTVDEILRTIGGSCGMLYTPTVVFDQGGFLASRQLRPEHLTDYTQHCHLDNDWFQAWAKRGSPTDVVVTGDMLLDRRTVRRSRLFNEFLKPLELYDMCTAILSNGQKSEFPVLFCTIFRGRNGKDFAPQEIEVLAKLLPHLKRGMFMNRMMAEQRAQRAVGLAVLERLSTAVFLVNRRSQVVYVNSKADALLRLADGLTVVGGRLRTHWPLDTVRLERFISATLLSRLEAVSTEETLSIPRPSLRPPFVVTAASLPTIDPFLMGRDQPAAVLFVTDPSRRPPVTARAMMASYDLTAAEANIALKLMEGLRPKDIMADLQLRITTVRTHLARIYMKTHTSGQSAFVRKVLTELAAPPSIPASKTLS